MNIPLLQAAVYALDELLLEPALQFLKQHGFNCQRRGICLMPRRDKRFLSVGAQILQSSACSAHGVDELTCCLVRDSITDPLQDAARQNLAANGHLLFVAHDVLTLQCCSRETEDQIPIL